MTVSDWKEHIDGSMAYEAQVLSYNQYYPFGMAQKARGQSFSDYRFGFNGQEEDIEIGTVHYKFREYDPRIVRMISVDPIASQYPELTPYQVASNSPIYMIELEGLEGVVKINNYGTNGKAQTTIMTGSDNNGNPINFNATGNGVSNLGINSVLEINQGTLPTGVNAFNVFNNAAFPASPNYNAAFDADDRSILAAGTDVRTILTDRMPPNPTLSNPPASDNLNSVGGFFFPGGTPNGNGNNTILERIGTFGWAAGDPIPSTRRRQFNTIVNIGNFNPQINGGAVNDISQGGDNRGRILSNNVIGAPRDPRAVGTGRAWDNFVLGQINGRIAAMSLPNITSIQINRQVRNAPLQAALNGWFRSFGPSVRSSFPGVPVTSNFTVIGGPGGGFNATITGTRLVTTTTPGPRVWRLVTP
jgi:RHS repeat-associated protein